jgi:Fe2+ transport system protein B
MNPEPDLIDRIANALPDELRADYYRELRHCRSLPENDEMLRILRVMQFLVVLTVQVPDRMATERQQFERVVADAVQMLQESRQFSVAHQAQLDRRMAQVSAHIAEELKPEAVAAAINESLRQQFIKSTIPETADALAVAAAQTKKATAEFVRVAGTLGDAYRGAVSEANTSIEKLKSTCTDVLSTTKRAVEELQYLSGKQHRHRFSGFLILAFILGAGLHWLYDQWRHQPPPEVNPAPVVQSAPPIKPPTKPKAKR